MDNEQNIEPIRRRRKGGHIWGGLLLLAIGALLLAKQTGAYIPDWLFSWQMLLIAIGIITGIKHQFRPGGWIILILIGGIFMYDRFEPNLNLYRYIWPLALIAFGMVIILKPRRSHRWRHDKRRFREGFEKWKEEGHGFVPANTPEDFSKEDFLDVTSVFGGCKKIVVSKNFRGGDITNFMGGTEVNFSQADIQGTVTVDTTNIFGGTKLIVPASWDVKSEATAMFGGIEDKRDLHAIRPDPTKVLIIDGTCIFGGIEIRNY